MTDITVIIPSYNHQAYILACLESLLSQTYTGWKAIVLDDKSQDSTLEIATNRLQGDARFTIVSNQENLGPYKNLNKGVNLVDTRFFTRLDADDTLDPEYLQKCRAVMDAPEIGACFVNFKYFNQTTQEVKPYDHLWLNRPFSIHDVFAGAVLNRSTGYFEPSLSELFRGVGLIRKSTQNTIGLFKEWRSEADVLMWLSIATKSKVYVLDEPLYHYRRLPSSITSQVANSNQDLYWKKELLIALNAFLLAEGQLESTLYQTHQKGINKAYYRHLMYRNKRDKKPFKWMQNAWNYLRHWK